MYVCMFASTCPYIWYWPSTAYQLHPCRSTQTDFIPHIYVHLYTCPLCMYMCKTIHLRVIHTGLCMNIVHQSWGIHGSNNSNSGTQLSKTLAFRVLYQSVHTCQRCESILIPWPPKANTTHWVPCFPYRVCKVVWIGQCPRYRHKQTRPLCHLISTIIILDFWEVEWAGQSILCLSNVA